MKDRIIFILIVCVALLGLSQFYTCKYTKKQKERLKTAQNNFTQSQSDNIQYKAKNGLLVNESKTYVLTINELKKLREEQERTIKDLRLKLKNVQSMHTISTKTEYIVQTIVRDSIIRDTVAQCFDYKTEWMKISGCVRNNLASLDIQNKDSIFSVGSLVYKGWWIFKKPIAVRQYVQSFNPSSKIMYNEYIMIKK